MTFSIPASLQLVVDDVGWFHGPDDRENGGSARTGMPRSHTAADYEALELLGRKTFARVMKKKDSGVYVRVRFELDPSKVAELRSRYALNDEIFRVQILAVDDRREALVVEQNARRKAKAEAEAAAAAEAEAAAQTAPAEE